MGGFRVQSLTLVLVPALTCSGKARVVQDFGGEDLRVKMGARWGSATPQFVEISAVLGVNIPCRNGGISQVLLYAARRCAVHRPGSDGFLVRKSNSFQFGKSSHFPI